MNQDSVIDKMVKIPLLTDMLNLVGVRPVRRSKDDVDALAKGWPLPGMRVENISPLSIEEANSVGPSDYQEVLDADNYSLLFDLDEENQRRGNFVRVFPDPTKPMEYLDMRETKRTSDYLARRHLELCNQGFNLLDDVCKKHLGIP